VQEWVGGDGGRWRWEEDRLDFVIGRSPKWYNAHRVVTEMARGRGGASCTDGLQYRRPCDGICDEGHEATTELGCGESAWPMVISER
jgi:hypothetical protein